MAHPITVPRLGWSMEQGKLIGWLKAAGDEVRAGEPLFELEGDKAVEVVAAIDAGTLCLPPDAPRPGDVVPVGAVLGYLVAAGEAAPGSVLVAAAVLAPPHARDAGGGNAPAAATPPSRDRIRISPRARRAARSLGVDCKTVQPGGSTGRIRERDVLAAARKAGLIAALVLAAGTAGAQAVLTGRLEVPLEPGSKEAAPLTEFLVIAGLPGPESQALAGRTAHEKLPWDKLPAGGYELSGPPGLYTLAFLSPLHFARPSVHTNLGAGDGERLERVAAPGFWLADFTSRAARPAAVEHWIPFAARGPSVTGIGFLPHPDGGARLDRVPGFLVSIHPEIDGLASETAKRYGDAVAERLVKAPEAGTIAARGIGAREFPWFCGWPSGEVPVERDRRYAVRVRAASTAPGLRFGLAWTAVAGDGDGLLVTCRSRDNRPGGARARFAPRWGQTFLARGRGLCAVVLRAACAGDQIPIGRQRVLCSVRSEERGGEVIARKIAAGTGNWTGDASWGHFAVVFAPGEAPLVPGRLHALEFETLETEVTLGGFVNIKGVPSSLDGGFAPFLRKQGDRLRSGSSAYLPGEGEQDFDLDVDVVEYEHAAVDWTRAVTGGDLLRSGWREFTVDAATVLERPQDPQLPGAQLLRVLGGSFTGKTADGGFVGRVEGLSAAESYRLAGRLRSTWAVSAERHAMVGLDTTGQTADPLARTIAWTYLPPQHGRFVEYLSPPVRPASDALSVWLRARATTARGSPIAVAQDPFGFRVEFAEFSLRQVASGVPAARLPIDVAAVDVVPHPASPVPGALVRIFLAAESGSGDPVTLDVTFEGRRGGELVVAGEWAWYEGPASPDSSEPPRQIHPGCATVISFNGIGERWAQGSRFTLGLADLRSGAFREVPVVLSPPAVSIRAVTFVSAVDRSRVPSCVVHVENSLPNPIEVTAVRIHAPRLGSHGAGGLELLQRDALEAVVPARDRAALKLIPWDIPLSRGAIAVDWVDAGGQKRSAWASARIKLDSFDIAAGRLDAASRPGKVPLWTESFAKLLRRLQVNLAIVGDAPACLQRLQNVHPQAQHPTRMAGRFREAPDPGDAHLAQHVHLVELDRGQAQAVSPAAVHAALRSFRAAPYPTALVLADDRQLRLLAGAADLPQLRARGAGGPAAGDLAAALRDVSRPLPFAVWVQNAAVEQDLDRGGRRAAPTPDEVLVQAYEALASGAKSLYWDSLQPWSILENRELIAVTERIGREIRALEDIYLEGDAYRRERRAANGRPSLDLASIVGPEAALLFAIDLEYEPDRDAGVFRFGEPRRVEAAYALPRYLRGVEDVFAIGPGGPRDVEWTGSPDGIVVRFLLDRVQLIVAALDPDLRDDVSRRFAAIRQEAEDLDFDPAGNDDDFRRLLGDLGFASAADLTTGGK